MNEEYKTWRNSSRRLLSYMDDTDSELERLLHERVVSLADALERAESALPRGTWG